MILRIFPSVHAKHSEIKVVVVVHTPRKKSFRVCQRINLKILGIFFGMASYCHSIHFGVCRSVMALTTATAATTVIHSSDNDVKVNISIEN